ncbi:3-deoxy-D-arabino-heptulosonate 7-phosphate (DAHP) synthase [Cohnella lubricantis]|nr:3-deoxy-D-arabino-heptulosonate 7-phosphate (DAHP) synthase [Cohnella lubricantis]
MPILKRETHLPVLVDVSHSTGLNSSFLVDVVRKSGLLRI